MLQHDSRVNLLQGGGVCMVVMPIFAASLLPPLEASQQVTMTVASLLTETGGAMTDLVPDFGIYAAGAVVVGLAIYGIRRVIKAGR